MATIYDLAKECNVSIATISKALNGTNGVSEKTREKIKVKAEELGYFPNAQAVGLATKKSRNIGVLFTDDSKLGLSHTFFSVILEKLRFCIEAKGFDLCFVAVNSPQFGDDYYKHCKYKGFDGVVVMSIDFNSKSALKLYESEIPVVLIDKKIEGKTSISSENFEGAKRAALYLAKCGHKKIGFIHGQELSISVTDDRIEGFKKGLEEGGVELNDKWLRKGSYYEWKVTHDIVIDMLLNDDRPTAIMLPDDYSAIGAYKAVEKLGMKIPEDISFIGCDGLELGEIMTPQLTTIAQDAGEIGRLAGEEITRLVESNDIKTKQISVDTTLVIRDSVKMNM